MGCYNGLAAEYATTVSLRWSDGEKRLAACTEGMQANVRRVGGAVLGKAGAVRARKGDWIRVQRWWWGIGRAGDVLPTVGCAIGHAGVAGVQGYGEDC